MIPRNRAKLSLLGIWNKSKWQIPLHKPAILWGKCIARKSRSSISSSHIPLKISSEWKLVCVCPCCSLLGRESSLGALQELSLPKVRGTLLFRTNEAILTRWISFVILRCATSLLSNRWTEKMIDANDDYMCNNMWYGFDRFITESIIGNLSCRKATRRLR